MTQLYTKAQYNWLLFLDSDVTPTSDGFLNHYLNAIDSETEAFFGGFAYDKKYLNSENTLRYTFGIHREEIAASQRNSNPYKVIISANFIIKKTMFLKVNGMEHQNVYGLDYLFGATLKHHGIKIKHLDNEVFHLGIDENSKFLEKSKKAMQTLATLYKSKTIKTSDISLLKAFKFLKTFGLSKVFGKFLKKFNSKIERNLKSASPSLFLFDLYRLGYFCRIV